MALIAVRRCAADLGRGGPSHSLGAQRSNSMRLIIEDMLLRTAKAGAEDGLEQQAFQLLESPFPCCDHDLAQLESLNMRATVK